MLASSRKKRRDEKTGGVLVGFWLVRAPHFQGVEPKNKPFNERAQHLGIHPRKRGLLQRGPRPPTGHGQVLAG